MKATRIWLAAALAAAGAGHASPATTFLGAQPSVIDLGGLEAVTDQAQISLTVALKLRNTDLLEPRLKALYAPDDPSYRKFLTPQQFNAEFGPTAATTAKVMQHFQNAGLHVVQLTATHLSVSGTAAAIQAEFGVEMHAYEVSPSSSAAGYRFRAPQGTPRIASDIVDAVEGVAGFDTRPHYRPQFKRAAGIAADGKLTRVAASVTPNAANEPGSLTVADFAKYYDVDPLYRSGLDGKGATIGIVTLASFTPSDAFEYWQVLGLKVDSHRIHEVQVDGGAGPVSDVGGSLETTLDVEQSGGLSPASKILVYEAPNTDQGFVDAFAKAIDGNTVDTLSCSWGGWEFFDLISQGGGVTDPVTGRMTNSRKALNDLFLQAAFQGQSIYVSAGDAGAYDETDDYTPPSWPLPRDSVVLSVEDPADQQWVTTLGGTTLAGPQTFEITKKKNLTIEIPHEQTWGWDYLIPLCTALGYDPLSCGIYPGGGGGGVSSYVPLPFYQWGIPGIQRTAPNQTLLDYSQKPPAFVVKLPAGYPGRNVPDISLNSDPDTGYQVYYTDDQGAFSVQTGWGGTSFAAPQFNGVTALFNQAAGHRLGLLNFALYDLVRFGVAYQGREAPLRDITAGDDWHYSAHGGYDLGTGLGVPDFANLLKALR